jgi:hypothetical protein
LALVLAGCASYPPARVVAADTPEIVESQSLRQWLNLQEQVAAMPVEQAAAELETLAPARGANDLFYSGLLKQQMSTYEAWIQARDTFRGLQQDAQLDPELRQLAALLEQSNQDRINWYQRYGKLQQQFDELEQQLRQSEQEKAQLQGKIQALTELEQAISTRREQ